MCVCVHVCVYMRVCACIFGYLCACTCVCTGECISASLGVYLCVCVCFVCVLERRYVHYALLQL